MNDLAIISLIYLEPEYEQTKACLENIGYDVFYADRDGVGNMSRAFNECFIKNVIGRYEAVWFITNITFDQQAPGKLLRSLFYENAACIHPSFDSDHRQIKPDGSGEVKPVNFIEFTAPMFKCSIFEIFMLDENCWYYFFDLIISKNLRDSRELMIVDHSVKVEHVYLRNKKGKSPITRLRQQLRDTIINPINEKYMTRTFGNNWKHELWTKWI